MQDFGLAPFTNALNHKVKLQRFGFESIEQTLWIADQNWSSDDLCFLLFALRQYDSLTYDWIDPEEGLKHPSIRYPLQGVEKELIPVYERVLIDHNIDFGLDKGFHQNLSTHLLLYICLLYTSPSPRDS